MLRELAVLTALVGSCAEKGARMSAELRDDTVEEVRAWLAEYQNAVASGHLSEILRFYSQEPGFHWIENGRVVYDSYAAVASAFEGLAEGVAGLSLQLRDIRVRPLAPGVAAITVSFRQVYVTAGEERSESTGILTAAVVEREDGWVFSSGHASSSPEAAAAGGTS